MYNLLGSVRAGTLQACMGPKTITVEEDLNCNEKLMYKKAKASFRALVLQFH